MGFHFVSCDVKIAAINLFEHELLPLHTILDVCGFSEWTWYGVMKLWCDTGNVINPKSSLGGCVCYLNCKDVQHLLCKILIIFLMNSSTCWRWTILFLYTMLQSIKSSSVRYKHKETQEDCTREGWTLLSRFCWANGTICTRGTWLSVKYPYPLGPSCTIPQSIGEIAW